MRRHTVGGPAVQRPAAGGPADSAERLFRSLHDRWPAGVWSAPGRVNLIGEHTDYNNGFVLPFALPQRVAVAASPRADEVLTIATLGSDGRPSSVEPIPLAGLRPGSVTGWPAYVAGVAWVLAELGLHRGADLVLAADVPTGAGLSSSAAVECAVLIALLELGAGADDGTPAEVARLAGVMSDADVALRAELARLAQRAENAYVGVPCGVLDQTASLCCVAEHALFLDVRSGRAEHVPFDAAAEALSLLVIDTRASHSLADSAYAARRAGCERAAELLGLASLREVEAADLDQAIGALPTDLARLVRHVVSENGRVREVVALLRSARVTEIGPLLDASHESLRHDYRVSCAELDLAVEAARGTGAFGARMTGGGFGGSAIALVNASDQASVAHEVRAAFGKRGLRSPRIFGAVPSAGAGRDK